MTIIIPANSAADTAFSVDNSCRFEDGDSASMNKALDAGDPDQYTISVWVKRSKLGKTQYLLSAYYGGDDFSAVYFEADDSLSFKNYYSDTDVGQRRTNRKFRDPSAWYHLVFIWDSANGTAEDRQQIWVNGVRETSWVSTAAVSSGQNSYFGEDSATLYVGQKPHVTTHFGGYMAEVCLINSEALPPSNFGEFDEDSPTIWKPKDVSELTFGTNGFYLDFEDSANLGNDANGGTCLLYTSPSPRD